MKVFLWCLVLVSACNKPLPGADKYSSIKLQNSSGDNLWYYVSYKLPDTTLENVRPANLTQLKAGEFMYIDNRMKWERVIDTIRAKKLAIYLIAEDTLNRFDWNTIRDQYLIRKRLEVTAAQLEANNWTVQY